jgi:hypothetical protein
MNFTPRSRFSDNVPPSFTRNELLDAYFVQKNTTDASDRGAAWCVYKRESGKCRVSIKAFGHQLDAIECARVLNVNDREAWLASLSETPDAPIRRHPRGHPQQSREILHPYTVSRAEKKTVYVEYEWHVYKIKTDSSNLYGSSTSEPWAYVRTFSDGHEALTYARRLNKIEGRLAHSPSGLSGSPIVSPITQDALSTKKDKPSLYRIRKVNWNVWSVSKIEADNKWRFVKVFYAEQDALDFVRICDESVSSTSATKDNDADKSPSLWVIFFVISVIVAAVRAIAKA